MKLQHGKTKSGSASLDGSYDTCIKKDGDASGLEESFDDTTPTISGNSSQDSTYAERSPKEDDIEGVLDSVVEKLQAEEENTFIRKDSSEIKESLTAPIICCKNEETINEVVTEEPLMPQESATEASISILNYDNHDDDDDNDDRSADRRSNCASVNFDSNRTRENLLESSGENNNNIEEGYAPPKKVEAAVQTIPDCSIETVARSCQTTESIWNMNFCDGCKRNNGKVTKNIFELVKKNIKDAVRFKQSSMLVDEEAKTESKSKKYSVKFTAFGSLEKADGNSISAADSSMGIKIRRLDFTPVWSRVCDELDEAAFNESFIDSPVKRKNMQSQGTRKRKRGKNVASSRKHLSRRVNEEKSQGSVIDSQEADFDGAHSQETDDETRKRFDGDKESSSGIVSQETEVSRDVTDVVNEKAELCAESCKEQSNPVEGKEIDDVVPPTPPSELPLNDTVYSSNRSVLSKVLQKGGKTRLITDDKRDAKLPLSKVENISNEISLSSVILDDVSENGSQNMFMSGIKGNQSISRNSQVVLESQEDGPKTPNVKCGVSEKPGRDCLVPDEDNSVEKRQTRRVTLKRKAKGPKIGTDNVTKKQKLESICENVNTDSQNGNLSGKSIASKKVSSFQTDSLYDIDSQILIGSENPSGLGQNTESSAEVSKKSQETLVTTGEHGSIVGQHDAPFLVTESRIDISFNDSPIDIVNSQKTNNCVKDNDFQNSAQGNEEQNDRNQEGVLNNNEFTQDIPSSILATSNDQNTADELADTCLEDVPLKKEEFPLEEDECINDAAILFDSNEEVDEGVGGGVGERVDEGVDERVDEGVDDEVEDAAMVKAKENGNNEEAYELCGVKRAGKQSTARAEQFSCLDDDEKDLFASDEEDLIEEEDAAHEEAGTTIEGRTAEPKNDDPEKKNTSDFKSLVRRFSKKGYEENEAEESSEEEPEFIKPSPERYLENNTSIKMKRHYASEAGSELVLVKNTEEITDNCEYESPPSPTPPPRIKKKKTSPQFQETMEMLKKLAAKNDRPMLIEKVDDATVPHKVKPKAAGDVESLSVMTGVNINTRKTEKAEGCHAKNFRKTTENALLPFTGASERFQPGKGQVDNHEFMRQNTPNRGDAHAVNKMTDNKLTVVPQLTVKREIVTTPKLKSESQLRDRGNLNTVGGSFESPARTHKTPSVLVPSRLNRRQMVCCKALADKIGCKFSTSFIDGVSHLIMGTDENFAIDRFAYTYKYLMALITGSWIVSFKWVTSSLNAQKVVDEAQYEVKGDISSNHEMVPKLARNSKQRKDSPLFTDLTLSLVGDFQTCNMTREQLAQLLEKGGAVVMFELPKSIPSKNFLLITDSEDIEGFKSQFIEANIQPVHYQWITESIINYKVQNPAEFLINL
ncbi:uncharacterized protein LOC135681947 isoform X1 [Rhopilema esculentum]|uniref:uncharacterized protein LOC135681947 isoform X1 n=1 Tax=Rhopilema esculentum TaxID=499914 RepID=UPI0031D5A89D